MTTSFSFRPLLACLVFLASILSSPRPIGAQAELLPAVAISSGSLIRETWPGRFNADGHTDLVSQDPETGRIAVTFGNGDGTFGPIVTSPITAYPVAVRDINRDGFADVIAFREFEGTLHVLRGNGNGTFTIATTFASGFYTFVMVDDFDKDGHRDLAVGEEPSSLHLFRGFGDFTFAPPITYETGLWPHGAIVADFNNDTLVDLAVATRYQRTVDLFLNAGGFLFNRGVIEIGRSATDVAARDLNGDLKTDLVVSARGRSDDGPWDEGAVHVFFGHGNGTFAPPTIYPTVPGTQSVVIGDFTRDGRPDIATVNRSAPFFDDRCSGFKNVDSASILAGNGDGTFRAHVSFALSSQLAIYENAGLHNMVESLNTSDLNADGQTDLIASHGVILLNEAPRANRLPVARAGEDQRSTSQEIPLRGGGADPDGHFLTFSWQHSGGFSMPPVAFFCYPDLNFGANTFTLTVDDGQGGRASDAVTFTFVRENAEPTAQVIAPSAGAILQVAQPFEIRWTAGDSDGTIAETFVEYSEDDGGTFTRLTECDGTAQVTCAWTGALRPTEFGRIRVSVRDDLGAAADATSGRFRVRSGSGGNELPVGWFNADVGAVGTAGRASYTTGSYTVAGSGADVWGTADELHFAYTQVEGDFDFIARAASVQNLDKWVKAGLMVREHTGAGARHAFAIATPRIERGLAFQRRTVDGGTSLHTAGPAIGPPVFLWTRRRANVIDAFYSRDEGASWTSFGHQTFAGLAPTLLVGFGVSSHVDGTLATAKFDHVSLVRFLPGTASPRGWLSLDVGAVALAGSSHYISPGWSVNGSGADVWGTADELHFAFTHVEGDFDISGRITQVRNLDKWVKAGLMIRETLNAGSRHTFAIATPRTERGVAFQRRPTTDGPSLHTSGPPWAPPLWLKLSRRGNTITAQYRRTVNDAWVKYGTQTYSALPANLMTGFAVSSHVDGTNAFAFFDLVSIDPVR